MGSEHAERESDRHRWANDGGFIPTSESPAPVVATRSLWRAIGVAAALGFAIGWLTVTTRPAGR
jgi:hypothetical protein